MESATAILGQAQRDPRTQNKRLALLDHCALGPPVKPEDDSCEEAEDNYHAYTVLPLNLQISAITQAAQSGVRALQT